MKFPAILHLQPGTLQFILLQLHGQQVILGCKSHLHGKTYILVQIVQQRIKYVKRLFCFFQTKTIFQ